MAAARILIWLPVRLVCRSSISNMAFSLWRLFVFFGGRRACAPTVLEGYPVSAGNGRAAAGEMTEYYRPINKPSAGFARTGRVPGATFPDFSGGDETGRCRQTAGERLISLRFPADTGDQLASRGPISWKRSEGTRGPISTSRLTFRPAAR